MISLPAHSSQTTIALSPFEIIRIAVHNAEKNDLLKNGLISYQSRYIEQELWRNGTFKSTKKNETYRHGNAYPENIRKDANNTDYRMNWNGLLLNSYEYEILDPDRPEHKKFLQKYQLAGYPKSCGDCYLFKFRPKTTLPNVDDIAPVGAGLKEKGIHEAAMRMEGVVFINKEYIFIQRFTAGLDNSYNRAFGSVSASRGLIDLEQVLRQDLDNLIVFRRGEIMYQIKFAYGIRAETRKLIWEYDCYFLNSGPEPACK